MKWLDRWFRRQCEKAWTMPEEKVSVNKYRPSKDRVIVSEDSFLDNRQSHTIRMQSANGGTIVEVSRYDNNIGEWNRDLFIITSDQELANELASILVQYQLRHG